MKQPKEFDEFERALASLRPRGSQVNCGRLMYQAGQASVVGTSGVRPIPPGGGLLAGWAWPATTAAMALASVVLTALLVMRPEPEMVREIVYVERPVERSEFSQQATMEATFTSDEERPTPYYLIARRAVLMYGMDALPSVQAAGDVARTAPTTVWEMMNEMREGDPGDWWPRSNRDGLFN